MAHALCRAALAASLARGLLETTERLEELLASAMPADPPPPADAGSEIDQLMRETHLPEDCAHSEGDLVFNFAIGSIFNDESRHASAIFNRVRNKSGKQGSLKAKDISAKDIQKTLPSGYDIAFVNGGLTRMWTYPSGGPWNIWAVSLHEDRNSTTRVMGGVVPSSKETFVMMRPREAEYDIVVLPAESVEVQTADGTKTLREHYPCSKILVYAYGYKDRPASIVDEGFLDKHFPGKVHFRHDNPQLGQICQEVIKCGEVKGKGRPRDHFLAQSYIDVILEGLLQRKYHRSLTVAGGDVMIYGGADEANVSRQYAEEFVKSTEWPIEEIKAGRVLWINDRPCPRNPNPLYTPADHLSSPHHGGISSSGTSIDTAYEVIDQILGRLGQTAEIFKWRHSEDGLCEHLDVLKRANTDKVLDDPLNVWSLAYNVTAEMAHTTEP